jgi:hypothetical protein
VVKKGKPREGGGGYRGRTAGAGSAYKGRYATVGSVLSEFIAGHPEFRYQVKVREALPAWHRISDDYVVRHTEAVKVKDRTLYVNTDSSALASELTLRGKELLEQMNRTLGTPILERIVFKSGQVARKNGGEEADARGIQVSSRLSAGTLKRIDSAAGVIREEELREIMKRFLRVAAQRSREQGKG